MPTQRDFSVKLLENSIKTTAATTATYIDLGASPSIAKRECKVILMSSGTGTAAVDYQLMECATTGGTYTACVTADTTAALATSQSVAPIEVHYWVTKRYVRMEHDTAGAQTGASISSYIQILNRSV
jgi:hypothetical protein